MNELDDEGAAQIAPRLTLLSDQALYELGNERAVDLLGLEQRLGPVLDILRHADTATPMTVALHGDWGTGKTSAMRWLMAQLGKWGSTSSRDESSPMVHCVWFDPWKYHNRVDVWRGLVAEVVLYGMEHGSETDARMNRDLVAAARQLGGFLGRSFLTAMQSVSARLELPGGSVDLKGAAMQDLVDDWQAAAHPELPFLNEFEVTLKNCVGSFTRGGRDRLVVFIDDLDRCLPEVALEVLEALKLYLSISGLVFVLGVDREVVDAIVSTHYRDHGISSEKCARYLDKMFQVEVPIAPSESQIRAYIEGQFRELNRLTEDYWQCMSRETSESEDRAHEALYRGQIEDAIRSMCGQNPREAKRLINGCLVSADAAVRYGERAGSRDRGLLFAQGAQVFLIGRLIEYWYADAREIMRQEEGILFLREWSGIECKNRSNPRGSGGPRDHRAAVDEAGLPKGYESLERCYGEQPWWPIARKLLADHDLSTLMSIPFAVDVAANATVESGGGASIPGPREDRQVIMEAVARQLRRRAELLTDKDRARVKKLSLSGTSVRDLSSLASLPNLMHLNLDYSLVKDLTPLARLKRLQHLSLVGCRVEDLEPLASLGNLQVLDLEKSCVADVAPVAGLSKLKRLSLVGTQVVEIGSLVAHPRLDHLDLRETRVPTEQAEEFQGGRFLRVVLR